MGIEATKWWPFLLQWRSPRHTLFPPVEVNEMKILRCLILALAACSAYAIAQTNWVPCDARPNNETFVFCLGYPSENCAYETWQRTTCADNGHYVCYVQGFGQCCDSNFSVYSIREPSPFNNERCYGEEDVETKIRKPKRSNRNERPRFMMVDVPDCTGNLRSYQVAAYATQREVLLVRYSGNKSSTKAVRNATRKMI